MILRNFGLSQSFLRAIFYSRKTMLEVGLLTPAIIIDILVMKLYLGHMRVNDRISKVI